MGFMSHTQLFLIIISTVNFMSSGTVSVSTYNYAEYYPQHDMYYQTTAMACGPTSAANMVKLLNTDKGELSLKVLNDLAVDAWRGYEKASSVENALNYDGYYGYGFEPTINKHLSAEVRTSKGSIKWHYLSPPDVANQSSRSNPAMLVVGNSDMTYQHWIVAIGTENGNAKFLDPAKGPVSVSLDDVEEGKYVGSTNFFKQNGAYAISPE